MIRKSFTVTKDDIVECARELGTFAEINGQINENALSRVEFYHEQSGVMVHRVEIGPDGYVAPHKTEGIVSVYIIQGTGVLGLVRPSGEVSCEVYIKEGDMITFTEDAPEHFYKAKEGGMMYVAVVVASK